MKARKTWQSSPATMALIAAGVVAACTATVGDPHPPSGISGTSSGGTGSSNGGAGSSGVGGAPSSGSSGAVGSTASNTPFAPPTPALNGPAVPEGAGVEVMRRLSYPEYDHMLADLLGDTTAPAETAGWPADVTGVIGFIAPNGVAELQVQYINQTADTVAGTAIAAIAAGKIPGKLSIACTNPATMAAETACATQFIQKFGQYAYRRPVAALEQADLLTLFGQVRGYQLSFTDSIGALVKAMIQSPNFLYHWEIGPTKPVVGSDGLAPLTQWQIASRLASALWQTMPDDNLLAAAQSGMLSTAAQIQAQAVRMLADPRAAQALFDFHSQLLLQEGSRVIDVTQVTKDPAIKLYTPAASAGMKTEFTEYLSSVYSTGDGTLGTLLAPAAPYTFVNKDLAAIYGVSGPATGFAKVMLNPTERAGILTQTAFLATNANPSVDNPVLRGLNIWSKLFCGTYMSPPANIPAVSFKPGTTTRQTYEQHQACGPTCHGTFDPPGFGFENYDAIGGYRTTDANLPVDATGTFSTPFNAVVSFKDGVDLSKQLAQSSEVQQCFDRQWTRYILARMETMDEQGSLQTAYAKGAATAAFSLRDMLTTLVSSKAFTYRKPGAGEML
jgi:Protein of unknown function (DUF1592)/Protein of unknown function (DUF1588)/Protein of unknown function (DUF1595)/Protein of unknown function (DUF1585)